MSALNIARLMPPYRTQSLAAYLAGLANEFGGAEWPLNDAVGVHLVADNRANSSTPGSNVMTNGGLTGNPITSWTEFENGSGVVTPQEPGVRVNAGATGAGSSLLRDGDLVQGTTYLITAVVSANTGPGTALFKTGNGSNAIGMSVGFTGSRAGRLVADTSRLQLSANSNCDVTYASVTAQADGLLDLAISLAGVTLAQAGENGVAASAMDLNGSNGMLYLPAQATINGMTNFIAGGMINPDATGANDRLLFKTSEMDVLFNADGTVSVTVNYNTTNATCTTVEAFSTGTWQHFAVGISSADNLPRVYKNGVECTYSATQAGSSTRVSNSNNLQFFKNAGTDGFDGKAQKLFLVKAPATRADIVAQIYALRNAA